MSKKRIVDRDIKKRNACKRLVKDRSKQERRNQDKKLNHDFVICKMSNEHLKSAR